MIEIIIVDLIEYEPTDDKLDENINKITMQLNLNDIDSTSRKNREDSALITDKM